MDAGGRHPHFVSPLVWHASHAEGLVAARQSQRLVLLVVGRQSCGGSRALVERTMAKEEIHDYLDAHYVCVAADADSPEPAVAELVARMPQHDRTPLCLYLSPENELMHSTSGGRPPAVFLSDLLEAPHRGR
jgi:uncharacterized protein YyaL (SSP411 family)